MHDNQVGDGSPQEVPRSVEDLTRDPAWTVTRSASNGHWILAEWVLVSGDRRWRVGMTPVDVDVVALIAWLDDIVVANTRGDEAALCAVALRWVREIHSGHIPG